MNSNKKPGIMIYFDERPAFNVMTGEQCKAYLIGMLDYGEFCIEPDYSNEPLLAGIWSMKKSKLDHDDERYQKKIIDGRYAQYKKKLFAKYGGDRDLANREILDFDEWYEQIYLPNEVPKGTLGRLKEPTDNQTCLEEPELNNISIEEKGTSSEDTTITSTIKGEVEGGLEGDATPRPSTDEVRAYADKIGYEKVDGFIDYYERCDYKIGGMPFDWKLEMRTWQKKGY